MPTGLNKSRDELPWLYYPRSNSVRVINSHLDGGGGGGWLPTSLSNLVGWYDPSDAATITSGSGLVSQLADKSGAALHLSQATSTARPTTGTRTQNSLNVLDCDGGDFLEVNAFPVPSSGNVAIFLVAVIDSVSTVSDSVFSMDATNDFQLSSDNISQFSGKIRVAGIGSDTALTGGPFPGPSVFCNVFNFTSGIFDAYIDGFQRTTSASYSTKLDASQVFRLFANRGANLPPNGAFGECIVCEDVDSTSRQKVEGYLAHKWGLAGNLDAGHPYKSAPPTV